MKRRISSWTFVSNVARLFKSPAVNILAPSLVAQDVAAPGRGGMADLFSVISVLESMFIPIPKHQVPSYSCSEYRYHLNDGPS